MYFKIGQMGTLLVLTVLTREAVSLRPLSAETHDGARLRRQYDDVWEPVRSFDASQWNNLIESCLDLEALENTFRKIKKTHPNVTFHDGKDMAMCFKDMMIQPRDFRPSFDRLSILKGKSFVFAGDSMMRNLAATLRCYSDHNGLDIEVAFEDIHFGEIQHPEKFGQGSDFVFANFGTHFNLQGKFTQETYRDRLQSFVKATKHLHERMFWVESVAQHYAGGTYYQDSLEVGDQCLKQQVVCTCANLKDTWADIANWRNQIANPIIDSDGIHLIRIFNSSYNLWNDHNGFDCTHYCWNGPFMRYQILLILDLASDRLEGEK